MSTNPIRKRVIGGGPAGKPKPVKLSSIGVGQQFRLFPLGGRVWRAYLTTASVSPTQVRALHERTGEWKRFSLDTLVYKA